MCSGELCPWVKKKDNCAAAKLVIKDRTEVADEDLCSALRDLLGTKRSGDALMEWFQLQESVSQSNLVALFRALLRISPHQNLKYAVVVEYCMDTVKRLELDTKYPAEVSAVRNVFDLALLKTLSSARASGEGAAAWWESVSSYAGLVLDGDSVETVLAMPVDGDPLPHADKIKQLHTGSETGKR